MRLNVRRTVTACSSFGASIGVGCCSPCSCRSFISTDRAVVALRPSKIVITPATPRCAGKFASRLRALSVPCVCVSSGVGSIPPLTFFNRGSHRDKCFTTQVLVLLTESRGRVIVFHGVRRKVINSGRRRGERVKFERCVRRCRPSYAVLRLSLRTRHGSRSGRVLSRLFHARPAIGGKVAFGSGICVINRCLRDRKGGSFGLVNCSLLRQGIAYLGRKDISFLVTRRPRLRNFGNVGTLYSRLVFGGRIAYVGCVPVSLLAMRAVSCCRDGWRRGGGSGWRMRKGGMFGGWSYQRHYHYRYWPPNEETSVHE